MAGVGIGVGSFIVAWVLYDLLCKSPLIKTGIYGLPSSVFDSSWICLFLCTCVQQPGSLYSFRRLCWKYYGSQCVLRDYSPPKAMVNAAKQASPSIRNWERTQAYVPSIITISRYLFYLWWSAITFRALSVMIIPGWCSPLSFGTAGVKHYLNLKRERAALFGYCRFLW